MGLYCGAQKTCVADCRPGAVPCSSGACDGNGRCVQSASPGPIFNVDGGLSRGDASNACITVDVAFERLTPTVIVLVDRSGSMLQAFDGARDRWDTLRDVLIGPSGILRSMQDRVRIGLTTYTSFDGNRGGVCPILEKVPPALNNLAAIERVYGAAEITHTEDDTPTSEALTAVTQDLIAVTEAGPKAIVLATDGEPDTCENADAHNGDTNALSVGAVRSAYDRGIRTDVISVGTEVGQKHLEDLANAGVGGTGGHPYRALDARALIDAFDTIIGGVVSCEFTLNGNVESGEEARGKVTLGGSPLAYQAADGWVLTAPNRLLLQGASCTEAKSGQKPLHIEFPCDTFTPIE